MVGVTVPVPGGGASVYTVDEKGGDEFSAETADDGTVTLFSVGPDDPGSTTSSGTSIASGTRRPQPLTPIAACDDDEKNVTGLKESNLFGWRIRTSTIPSYLNQANAIESIRNGIRNITNVNNDCLRGDNVSATANYEGSTTFQATFDGDNCLNGGGPNVVDFGPINNGRAAVACVSSINQEITFVDVRMNSAKEWTVDPGSGCGGTKFDIESVMTHERGHTFGIGHVGDPDIDTHSLLTMYPEIPLCTTSKRTLGKGDWLALEDIY